MTPTHAILTDMSAEMFAANGSYTPLDYLYNEAQERISALFARPAAPIALLPLEDRQKLQMRDRLYFYSYCGRQYCVMALCPEEAVSSLEWDVHRKASYS